MFCGRGVLCSRVRPEFRGNEQHVKCIRRRIERGRNIDFSRARRRRHRPARAPGIFGAQTRRAVRVKIHEPHFVIRLSADSRADPKVIRGRAGSRGERSARASLLIRNPSRKLHRVATCCALLSSAQEDHINLTDTSFPVRDRVIYKRFVCR